VAARIGSTPHVAHHPLAPSLSGVLDRPNFHKIRSDFANKLRSKVLPDFLISSETMSHYFRCQKPTKEITDFIASLGYEVVVILTLRDHTPFFKSAYTQRTKLVKSQISLVEQLQSAFTKRPQWHLPTIQYLLSDQYKCLSIPFNNAMKSKGTLHP